MFGMNSSDQASMGSPTVQNPSMLDNVSAQDFQTPSTTPATPQDDTTDHALTSDNPFLQQDTQATQTILPQADPASIPSLPVSPAPQVDVAQTDSSTATSPSAPVAPPVVQLPVEEIKPQDSTESILQEALPTKEPADTPSDTSTSPANAPIDQDKLADMKREALEHLEPLADHIDGTPEETFRTTMMMIQANDNHLLLQKALDAAKKIEDDKARAQAMLDIINEINYFSQIGPV